MFTRPAAAIFQNKLATTPITDPAHNLPECSFLRFQLSRISAENARHWKANPPNFPGKPCGSMTSVELMTTRLRLRDFELEDYQAVHAFATDLAVVSYVEWGPNTPEETQAFLREARASADVQPRRRYAFAVVHSDAERLIGSIELQVVSFEHRRGEIGYVLAHEWWGQGYATEATHRLLAFGFNELGLHKISATCDPENRASVAVLTKNGMNQEGALRDHTYVRGQWRDRLLFSVIADR
jgi:[ribosomal protein S5]-alanine N-acetyltransferase